MLYIHILNRKEYSECYTYSQCYNILSMFISFPEKKKNILCLIVKKNQLYSSFFIRFLMVFLASNIHTSNVSKKKKVLLKLIGMRSNAN